MARASGYPWKKGRKSQDDQNVSSLQYLSILSTSVSIPDSRKVTCISFVFSTNIDKVFFKIMNSNEIIFGINPKIKGLITVFFTRVAT